MSEKILIVDDDIDSLKLIGLMLQRQGYDILAANTGTQALNKAAADSPDLIILDVMMPDMDGYEVCRRLRANAKTQPIPIIMFTAKTLVDDKVAGFEAGADDYLTKPTHPAELASRVKAVLARRSTKASTAAKDQGNLLAILGTKGGLGTTTIATNIATLLNKKEATVLTDFRPGQGSLGASLGLARVSGGLGTLLNRPLGDLNVRNIGGEIVNHNTGLRLLLSSSNPREGQKPMTAEQALALTKQLRAMARLVIVDLGVGLSPVNMQTLQEATHILVAVDAQRITLNMGRELLGALNEAGLGAGRISVVMINRVQSSLQIAWQEAETILEHDILAVISPAPELAFQANEAHTPIINLQPGAIIANQFTKLAQDLSARVHVGVRP
jgi:pilus assembly protein CpaE